MTAMMRKKSSQYISKNIIFEEAKDNDQSDSPVEGNLSRNKKQE